MTEKRRRLRVRLNESAADFNRGEPAIHEGLDPLMSAFMFGIPIMIPQHHPREKIRLRYISWGEFKGICSNSCCGDWDD